MSHHAWPTPIPISVHTSDHSSDHTSDHTPDHTSDHSSEHTHDHSSDHTSDHAPDHTSDHSYDHSSGHMSEHTPDHTSDHSSDHTPDHTTSGNNISEDIKINSCYVMPLRDVEAADDISHLLANNQSITIPADVRFISATELPSPRNVAPMLTSITHRLLCLIYCTFALYTNHETSLDHNFPSPKPIISLSRQVTCDYFSLQTIFPLLHPQYLHVPVPIPPRVVIHPALPPPPLPGTVSANVYSPDKAVKSVRWPVWSWTLWSQLPSTLGNSSLHTW